MPRFRHSSRRISGPVRLLQSVSSLCVSHQSIFGRPAFPATFITISGFSRSRTSTMACASAISVPGHIATGYTSRNATPRYPRAPKMRIFSIGRSILQPMPRPRRRLRHKRSSRGLDLHPRTLKSLSGIANLLIGILLALALRQEAGPLGKAIQRILTFFAGRLAILFPILFTILGILHWSLPTPRWPRKRLLGLTLSAFAFLGLMHIGAPLEDIGTRRDELAGAMGFMVSLPFILFASRTVGIVVLSTVLLACILLAYEPDPLRIFLVLQAFRNRLKVQRKSRGVSPLDTEENDSATDLVEQEHKPPELNIVRPVFAKSLVQDQTEKALQEQLRARTLAQATQILQMKDTRYEEWTFPTYDLLEAAESQLMINDEELKQQARLIEEKLREFEIDVTVRDAHPGPTVTQFTLQPAEGVKLTRIGSLKDDLSLALAAQSLRIEAPIPGKSLVGIEMPNAV